MKKIILATLVTLTLAAPTFAATYQQQYNAVYGPNGTYTKLMNSIYGKGGLYCTLYGYNC